MIKSFYVFIVIVLVFSGTLRASEEEILNPSSVRLEANAGNYFGPVISEITMDKNVVQHITLEVNGNKINIPNKVYAYLKDPLLNTFQIRYSAGINDSPYLYLYVELANRTQNGDWLPKKVYINYHENHIDSLSFKIPQDDGSYSWENIPIK